MNKRQLQSSLCRDPPLRTGCHLHSTVDILNLRQVISESLAVTSCRRSCRGHVRQVNSVTGNARRGLFKLSIPRPFIYPLLDSVPSRLIICQRDSGATETYLVEGAASNTLVSCLIDRKRSTSGVLVMGDVSGSEGRGARWPAPCVSLISTPGGGCLQPTQRRRVHLHPWNLEPRGAPVLPPLHTAARKPNVHLRICVSAHLRICPRACHASEL
jgi:hypothetical protein